MSQFDDDLEEFGHLTGMEYCQCGNTMSLGETHCFDCLVPYNEVAFDAFIEGMEEDLEMGGLSPDAVLARVLELAKLIRETLV